MTTTIEQLITTPESKTLEFKRDLSSPKPLLKTLVAFANTAGGKLIIGITDDRTVLGVENPLDEEERLTNMIGDSISPRLIPNIEMTTVEGKTLLVIEVFLSNTRPHHLNSVGAKQGVYVRLGSSNRQADPLLIAEMQRGAAGISFDCLPLVDLSIADLDLIAIQEDFHNRSVDERMLQSLKILVSVQGRLVPSQGGILLYGKNRRFHFDDAWIQCGRFIGNDKGDIFDHIDIHDHLPKAVHSIMLFLKKHAMRGADFSDNCEEFFTYTHDGEIQATAQDDTAAQQTIEVLGLDIPKLNNAREKAIEPFLDEALGPDDVARFVSGYLKRDAQGKFNEFWTTINYLFGNLAIT
jgi:ATP-dependent DNA helicase RecG